MKGRAVKLDDEESIVAECMPDYFGLIAQWQRKANWGQGVLIGDVVNTGSGSVLRICEKALSTSCAQLLLVTCCLSVDCGL